MTGTQKVTVGTVQRRIAGLASRAACGRSFTAVGLQTGQTLPAHLSTPAQLSQLRLAQLYAVLG